MSYDSESGHHRSPAEGRNGNVKLNRYGRISTTIAVIFAVVGTTIFLSQSHQLNGRRLSSTIGEFDESFIPLSADGDIFSLESLKMSDGKYSKSATIEALNALKMDVTAYDSDKATLLIALQVMI